MNRDLTLLIPGFMRPECVLASEQPTLSRLLSRADGVRCATNHLEQRILNLFSIQGAHETLPVAPLTYLLDGGESSDEYLLRIDPIYCQPDRGRVVLMARELGLLQAEADSMIADLNRLFAEDGWQFIAPHPDRWYLKMPAAEQLKTTPLSSVMGHDIHNFLPQSPQGVALHRAMSEIEMLLHSNASNQQRIAAQQLPVNNVWIWGGGRLPAKPKTAWAQIWSDDSLVLAAAKHADLPRCESPETATQWLQQAITPGHHLIALAAPEEVYGYDQTWFAPLASALKSGQLNTLTLWLDNGYQYQITKKSLRRWWRKQRTMKQFL